MSNNSEWKEFVGATSFDNISEEQILRGVNLIKDAILSKYPFTWFGKDEDEDETHYYMYVGKDILFTLYQSKYLTVERDVDIKRGDEGIISLNENNKDRYLEEVYELLKTYPLLDVVSEIYNTSLNVKEYADKLLSSLSV